MTHSSAPHQWGEGISLVSDAIKIEYERTISTGYVSSRKTAHIIKEMGRLNTIYWVQQSKMAQLRSPYRMPQHLRARTKNWNYFMLRVADGHKIYGQKGGQYYSR